jgi:hypothetical protein
LDADPLRPYWLTIAYVDAHAGYVVQANPDDGDLIVVWDQLMGPNPPVAAEACVCADARHRPKHGGARNPQALGEPAVRYVARKSLT